MRKALDALGLAADFKFAADISKDALKVYKHNLSPEKIEQFNVENLIDFGLFKSIDGLNLPDLRSARLSDSLRDLEGCTDIFIAGPPCQGNSNLNNHSRRTDPRNELYIVSAAIGAKLS